MTTAHLYLYPLKGARGLDVARISLGKWGPHHDRGWMMVDAASRFVSLRTHPQLVSLSVWPTANGICMAVPERGVVSAVEPSSDAPEHEVDVWDDRVVVREARGEASEELSRWLDESIRLVWKTPDHPRVVDPRYATADDHVQLSDGFPLLVLSEASVSTFSAYIGRSLDVRRFRPNIVLSDARPDEEAAEGLFQVGTARIRLVKRCKRCSVITRGADGADVDPTLVKRLASYRGDADPWMGMNAIVEQPGVVSVGDRWIPVRRQKA